MGPETGNGRFWVCFGAEGKGKLWLARGENENKGKKAGIGEKGVLVLWSGVCGGKWLRWRNGGARWWLTWEKKMFFLKKEEGLRLFGQLRGNLVRKKKGRVSAGGGPCVRRVGVAEGFLARRLFFFSNEGV
ncbi:hypothetical protein H0E87_024693 [Populus deltoides]|uniref:Uncharacterized protein n=1 Tax=Populus deltoides TaxID=3696 RepID=A0A8T2X9T2_POPDE|nr:hypothetical protein H0E87_024693 [Populus deltoides]